MYQGLCYLSFVLSVTSSQVATEVERQILENKDQRVFKLDISEEKYQEVKLYVLYTKKNMVAFMKEDGLYILKY